MYKIFDKGDYSVEIITDYIYSEDSGDYLNCLLDGTVDSEIDNFARSIKTVDINNIISSICDIVRNENRIIFYFSGHCDNKGYIKLPDTSLIHVDYLKLQIYSSTNSDTEFLFITDCCYSGFFKECYDIKLNTDNTTSNFVKLYFYDIKSFRKNIIIYQNDNNVILNDKGSKFISDIIKHLFDHKHTQFKDILKYIPECGLSTNVYSQQSLWKWL